MPTLIPSAASTPSFAMYPNMSQVLDIRVWIGRTVNFAYLTGVATHPTPTRYLNDWLESLAFSQKIYSSISSKFCQQYSLCFYLLGNFFILPSFLEKLILIIVRFLAESFSFST